MIVFNVVAVLIILFVITWFWLVGRRKAVVASQAPILIIVADGVYTPDNITVKVNQPVTLQFLRKDPSPCAETVLFPELNASLLLALNEKTFITLSPKSSGVIAFTCQMGMYRGQLTVV